MDKNRKIFWLTIATSLVCAMPSFAKEPKCIGREYHAKALNTGARSARLEVDWGFGMIYRGLVELDDALEPAAREDDWYGKASAVSTPQQYPL